MKIKTFFIGDLYIYLENKNFFYRGFVYLFMKIKTFFLYLFMKIKTFFYIIFFIKLFFYYFFLLFFLYYL